MKELERSAMNPDLAKVDRDNMIKENLLRLEADLEDRRHVSFYRVNIIRDKLVKNIIIGLGNNQMYQTIETPVFRFGSAAPQISPPSTHLLSSRQSLPSHLTHLPSRRLKIRYSRSLSSISNTNRILITGLLLILPHPRQWSLRSFHSRRMLI